MVSTLSYIEDSELAKQLSSIHVKCIIAGDMHYMVHKFNELFGKEFILNRSVVGSNGTKIFCLCDLFGSYIVAFNAIGCILVHAGVNTSGIFVTDGSSDITIVSKEPGDGGIKIACKINITSNLVIREKSRDVW